MNGVVSRVGVMVFLVGSLEMAAADGCVCSSVLKHDSKGCNKPIIEGKTTKTIALSVEVLEMITMSWSRATITRSLL